MREIGLACHPGYRPDAVRAVTARVARSAGTLGITYRIEAEIDRLRLPPPAEPRVAERLWEHTCLELFVSPGGDAYEEFNFSPSGEWAAYAFTSYRQGRARAAPPPRITVQHGGNALELHASVEAPGGQLALGLCAVIEARDGRLSYWALRHGAGEPDFHRREAFALHLE